MRSPTFGVLADNVQEMIGVKPEHYSVLLGVMRNLCLVILDHCLNTISLYLLLVHIRTHFDGLVNSTAQNTLRNFTLERHRNA